MMSSRPPNLIEKQDLLSGIRPLDIKPHDNKDGSDLESINTVDSKYNVDANHINDNRASQEDKSDFENDYKSFEE